MDGCRQGNVNTYYVNNNNMQGMLCYRNNYIHTYVINNNNNS